MAVTVYVRERRCRADRAPESTIQRRYSQAQLSSRSRSTSTESGSIVSSSVQACSCLPSDSRSSSAHSGEQACGADGIRRRTHLFCVERSSASSRTSSARIVSVAVTSPSTCCSRVVSVEYLRRLKAELQPWCERARRKACPSATAGPVVYCTQPSDLDSRDACGVCACLR